LDGNLEVRIEQETEGLRANAHITARLNERLMRQTVTFQRAEGGWRAAGAVIEPGVRVR
jgi:hypothetical protein